MLPALGVKDTWYWGAGEPHRGWGGAAEEGVALERRGVKGGGLEPLPMLLCVGLGGEFTEEVGEATAEPTMERGPLHARKLRPGESAPLSQP